jgi:UrcA family protein
MTMRNTILIAAALAAAAAFALPAQAQTAPRSQSVSTAGLDLGTAAGRAGFQRRVAAAVETVCGSYAGTSAAEQDEIGRCRRVAWSGVETQLAARDARRDRTIQVAAATR